MYSILIVIAGMVVCMLCAVTISVNASNKAIERAIQVERQNRQAQLAREDIEAKKEAARRAQERAASCQFIHTISNAYQEDPPTTPTGQNVMQAWAGLAARCK